MEWISIKDKLPKEYTEVLVYLGYGYAINQLCKGRWWDDEFGYNRGNDVTHWIELPNKPKK